MKFLIMLACTLAATSAHVFIPASYTRQTYLHHQQLPVPIAINGVPVDTVEVQNANAAHFAAKAQAQARAYGHFTANSHYHEAQATPHDVHVDTVEVQQAKHAHFTHKANARKDQLIGHQEYSSQLLVASGVPVDTVEVQQAKEAHFVHKARAYTRSGIGYQQNVQTAVDTSIVNPVYTGPQHIPVIGVNGVPVDTVEVQHAKEAHLAHTARAYARAASTEEQPKQTDDILPIYHGEVYFPEIINGVPEDAADYQLIHSVQNGRSEVKSVSQNIQAVSKQAAYSGPIHHPVISVSGVPLDTAEVQQAKEAHFIEKNKAYARAEKENHPTEVVAEQTQHNVNPIVYSGSIHHPVVGVNGAPIDTIEVQQAHVAEKIKANVRSGFKTVSQHQTDEKSPSFSGALHYPIIVNGVPLDTIAVQKAKEAHMSHKTNAQAGVREEYNSQSVTATQNGHQHHLGHVEVTHNYHSVPVVVNNMQTIYPGAQNYPVFGVPVSEHGKSTEINHKYIPQVRTGVPYPSYPVLQHIPAPVISTQIVNGVPMDTPAVQQAKAAHFAAKARAYAQHDAYTYETHLTKQ